MYKSVNICLLVKRACRFTIHFIHFPSFGLNFFLFVKLSVVYIYPVVCYKETAKAYSKSQQGVRRKRREKKEKSLSEATTKNQFPIS